MQSAKKMKALSVLSMAVVATMGVKAAHAATVTLYYDNINDISGGNTVQSYNYGTAGGDITQIPTTINIGVGDTFQFGVDAVVTNNVNPDAGKKTGSATNHDVVQPSFLGLSTFSIVVPSTDTNASILAPNTVGSPTGTFGSSPDFQSTASLNNNLNPGSDVGSNNGATPPPNWGSATEGDVAPTSSTGGDVGDHFGIFQGNGAEPNTASGLAQVSQYGAATATYGTATDFFDSLSYTALKVGTVTLSTAIDAKGSSYWENTQRGTTTTLSGYLASTFTNPGDVIGTLPVLVINVTGASGQPIVSLTSGSGPAPATYGSQEGALHITGSNGIYTHDQVTGLTSPTGFVSAGTFNPAQDTEVYGVDVVDGSGQATSAELAAVLNAIDGSDGTPASVGIVASSSVTGTNPYGFSNNYNLYLVASPGVDATDFLGIDLSNSNDSHLSGLSFSAVAVVPEPMSLGLLAIGGLGLMSRRNRRKM